MATTVEVLEYLIPNGGWVLVGDTFEGIEFIECKPITKNQFEAAFAKVDEFKAKRAAEEKAKKEAALTKLAALGLEIDDLKALGL
jgi:hypothetical protein